MVEFRYSDTHGYGTVYAHSISIYLYESDEYKYQHVNPIALLSPFGTFHFGIHTVRFQID